ncbi:MAG: FG-GAP-like repeat-containing protein [Desulfuromonadales bacterium]
MKIFFIATLAVLTLVTQSGHAAIIQLPATGQTVSYASGDDGSLRKGVAVSGSRFTDNGNGTVTDNLTSLIWLKNANCFDVQTWSTALGNANRLSSGTCSLSDGSKAGDWRLPNVVELESLSDLSHFGPTLPTGHPFTSVKNSIYWTSTTNARYTDYDWTISFNSGLIYDYDKLLSYYLWPVRTSPTRLSITTPADDLSTTATSITISGTVTTTLSSVSISMTADGLTYKPAIAGDGSFSQVINLATDKTYAVVVVATDQAGYKTTVQRNITKYTVVNGACGSSNGQTFTVVPAVDLCSTGTQSAITGSGPWNWTCNGSYGGTNASCSANKLSTLIPSVIWRHQGDGKIYGLATDGSSTAASQIWQEQDPAWSIVGRGDFDGDGIRDLVWWNSSTGQVYVMLMAGPVTVKSGAVVYTEPNTSWRIVATGDINGDAKSDLIWWNNITGQVYVMLLNGTAVAGSGLIYTEPDTNWKIVAAADFNGNSKVELLWWNSSTGQTAIGQTNGTSASSANLIWTEPNTNWRIAGAGDLDGDGKAEIVWYNRTTGQVYGMQTNGSSITNSAMIYTESDTNWEIVGVGNYYGDDKGELLWWNQLTGRAYLMPMNGLSVAQNTSTFYADLDTTWRIQSEIEWRDNVYGRGVTTSTLNPINGVCGSSNGQPFTIAPTLNLCSTGTASALTGSGPWSWSCSGNYGGTAASCSANKLPAAITTPSITFYHQPDGKVSGITTNGSTITGGAQFWQETNPAWQIVGQGDFDGDGVRDLVWQNSTTGQVYIMLMATPTTVKSGAVIYTESNTNWKIVATGDLNGDGKTDLIWWNKTTGQVSVLLVNGTTVTAGGQIYTEPNTSWKIVAAADFNGNGKVELLWWNSSTGQVALGQTNGTSASTAGIIWYEPDTNWRIAGAGDLDGDGKADIIWHNRTTGQVYGMQTNGSSVSNGAMMYTEANTNWEIVGVGSYNGDNKADLLWWNQLTGQLYLMPMNGLSVASGGTLLYTEPDTTWHIQGDTEWRDNLYGKGVTTTTK